MFNDLVNKYKNLLSGTANTLSSFVQRNPLPVGYAVKKFQETTRPIVQKMTTFQAPLERQTFTLPTSVKSAFPITQLPATVGEQVRSTGRLLSLRPNTLDLAQVGLGVAGVVKTKLPTYAKQDLDFIRKYYNPEVRARIGQFAQLTEQSPLGINRKNLGQLGDEIQSIAEATFGKKVSNLNNRQLKNLFDTAMEEAFRKNAPREFMVGLGTKPLRKVNIGVSSIRALAKSPIPSQETIDKAAQIRRQYKVASGQVPSETPSLPDIIQRGSIDVKDKVNLLDYIRTPDRVMKKIGMEKEATLLRKKYNDYLEELPQQINRITQWSKEVPPESNQRIFQYLDGKPIQLDSNELRVAGEIRSYLQKWADRLKLPQERRITNYITHIFDKDFIKKEFDPELAKLLENRVAGSVYDPFVEQRLGKMGYREDTWAALDAYVKRATRKVNMDEALSVIKEKAKSLELSQYKYVKQYVDRINLRPTDVDNLLDNTLKSLFGYKFGIRPTTELTRRARQAVYRGTLGLNVGSALKNLTQGANTYARLGEKYTILGYLKTAAKMAARDDELVRVGVLRDEFIQDRTLNATKKFWEKIDKGLFAFFELAEKINRGSAYFGAKAQALDRGLTENQAIQYALKTVRDTQFTFGSIDTPPILSSDINKLMLQFQSFTIKQGEFLAEMVASKDIAGLVRYGLASLLLAQTAGRLIGMEWKDFIPSLRFGLPPTLQAPIEVGKAIVGAPDAYGNVPDLTGRVENIGKALVPFIPGGVQIKKTWQGLQTVDKGYSESKAGRVRTPIEQNIGNKIRGALFGSSNLPEVQKYFDEEMKVLGEKQSQIFKGLTPEEQKQYFDLIQEKRKLNQEKKSAIDQVKAAESPMDDIRIDVAKERVKLKGGIETVGNIAVFRYGDKVKAIDISFPMPELKKSDNSLIQKEYNSDFNTKLSNLKRDVKDALSGGVISEDQAIQMIEKIESTRIKTAKAPKAPKKGKKPSFKIKAVKFSKLKLAKVKKIKIPKPKKVKRYTLKKPKIKTVKLSARIP